MSDTYLASPQLKPRDGDLFNIDAALTEEERAIRDSVRRFVDERVLPIIGDCYIDGRFPKELIPEMASLGVLGANLPEEYGCAGLNNVSYGLIMQELERGDSGIRSFASVQGALVMYPIYAFGSEEQKKYWLPQMAKGEVIGCFGLTETDYGSNPAGMITRARVQKDGSYILTGGKMWITNGTQAHVCVVWAKTEDGDETGKSIRGFLVPTDAKGFVSKPESSRCARATPPSSCLMTFTCLPTRSCRNRGRSRAR
jgi:glutaryl-CoA dehydrogenase